MAATYAGWLRSGWPVNHEFYAHFERVEAFRRAYLAGDWFPLWTPFSNNGHGSPIPLFYHRLFNTVASIPAVILGSTYAGVKIAVVAVAAFGALGMHRALKVLGASLWIQFCAAALLICSPYAMTDWLVRSSTAEFTAFMLLPWMYYYCLRIIRGEQVGGRLGVVIALLFYAHNALCLFSLIVPAFAAVICVVGPGPLPVRWARTKPFFVALLAFVVVAGPYVATVGLAGRGYNLAALNQAWRPTSNILAIERYLHDTQFRWGHQWQGLSPEVGVAIVAAFALLVIIASIKRAAPRAPELVLLAGPAAIYVFLQLPAAKWFYLNVPGAVYIGFPFRLLAMITTAMILLVGALSASIERSARGTRLARVPAVLAAAALAYQGWFCARAQSVEYQTYSKKDIENHLANLDVPTIGEYLPKGVGGLRSIPRRQEFIVWNNCQTVTVSGDDPRLGQHLKRMELTVDSPKGCTVRLDQFYSVFFRASNATLSASPTRERTLDVSFRPGHQTAVIRTRGLWSTLIASLRSPT